jgi:hypothetical protein
LEGIANFDLLTALPPVCAGIGEYILLHRFGLALLRTFLLLIFEF